MRKTARILTLCTFLLFGVTATTTLSSCTKKVGCNVSESGGQPDMGKKKYKSKSGLVDPKKAKKRG